MKSSHFWNITEVEIQKITLGVNLLRKLNLLLLRSFLPTVFKCFIRPHLDYGDVIVIYDQPLICHP